MLIRDASGGDTLGTVLNVLHPDRGADLRPDGLHARRQRGRRRRQGFAVSSSGLEVVVFEIAQRRFGVPAGDVQGVLRAVLPTPLPGAPAVVEGVVNLRGRVVPQFDLRRRFRLPLRGVEPSDHLIVARAAGRSVLLRVDRVEGLVHLQAAEIEEARGIVPGVEYVSWLARLPQDLVLVHDLATLLSRAEAEALDNALAAPAQEGSP
jgi:purine-binding chemotaxis protein CheW